MTDTPEDIRKKAETLCGFLDAMPSEGNITAIAEALMQERERCAKIADREGVYPELNIFASGPDWYKHGKRIRDAIRRSQPDTQEGK